MNAGAQALGALSANLARLSWETSPAALFAQPPVIRFEPERERCECGAGLGVQKTRRKTVLNLAGPFVAHETLLGCPECGRVYGSGTLLRLAPARCNVAYDVLAFTGRALFQRHRTVEEARQELAGRNVRLSASEVDYLGRKFIVCLARAHRQAVPRIRQAMVMAGGYVLHLDAMHEAEAPALVTGMDGLSQIVLANVKVPSENAEDITPFLAKVKADFGSPAACVHDMGVGLCKAVAEVFPGVPDFICHFHFLRDAGHDFLEGPYDMLRTRLRKHRASTRAHALGRELAQHLRGQEMDPCLLAQAIGTAETPSNPEAIPAAAAYALGHWALQGKHAGDGYGFPFDRPLLSFAERLLELRRRLPAFQDLFLRGNWRDNQPLYKLFRELSAAADDPQLRRAVKELRWRCELFDRLRRAMRIALPGRAEGLNDQGSQASISTIQRGVESFRRELSSDPKLAAAPPCRKLAGQIDKYAGKLFAGPLTVRGPHGRVTIYPQRTNNILEQFFRSIRHAHRRKTGNNTMNRALQTMLADTPLVKNLDNPRYLEILLDGQTTLEARFAELDMQPLPPKDQDQHQPDRILPGFTKLIRQPALPNLVASLFMKATPKSNRLL